MSLDLTAFVSRSGLELKYIQSGGLAWVKSMLSIVLGTC